MTDDHKPRKPRPNRRPSARKPSAARKAVPKAAPRSSSGREGRGKREPRTTGREERAAATRRTQAAAAPAPARVRRGRLYRIPVLGTIAYVIWPPRSAKPGLRRRVLS